MIVAYYSLKEGINQNILEQYGYTRPNENFDYCKDIKKDDRFVIITVNKAGRFFMKGYYYNMNIEECIKDLIDADLVDAVELDYSSQVGMEDPDEFEDDVVIGLGEEMLR